MRTPIEIWKLQRPVELKMKPMHAGSSQFVVLAIFLNDDAMENFL